jgi:hypothetical protein
VLYLLDANVLIAADRDYYPLAAVPEFWEWLLYQAQQSNVKVCVEVYEEVTEGTGDLVNWLKRDEVRQALLLDEESDQALVANVVNHGYAPDLTDIELPVMGRDPFLIAHAMKDIGNRTVVTGEASKPTKTRQNKHIPDVCTVLGVKWCPPFKFFKDLGFSTAWKLVT